MIHENRIPLSKSALLAGAGLASLSIFSPTSAAAQSSPDAEVSSDQAESQPGDVIVVTGTRIPTTGGATATPVVAVTAENIEQSGLTNVTELLTQTPALFNSEDNFDAA